VNLAAKSFLAFEHSPAVTEETTVIPLLKKGWVTTLKLATDQPFFFSPYSRTPKPIGSFINQRIMKMKKKKSIAHKFLLVPSNSCIRMLFKSSYF